MSHNHFQLAWLRYWIASPRSYPGDSHWSLIFPLPSQTFPGSSTPVPGGRRSPVLIYFASPRALHCSGAAVASRPGGGVASLTCFRLDEGPCQRRAILDQFSLNLNLLIGDRIDVRLKSLVARKRDPNLMGAGRH
jgi:hypothetical protein